MTAAELRGLTTAGPVLACSPVALVGPDGRRFRVTGWTAEVPGTTDDEGRAKPAGVPVLVLAITEEGERDDGD